MIALAAQKARWSVYVKTRDKLWRKRFGDDFKASLKFYEECRKRGFPATLHCDNVAIYPPSSITHHPRIKYKIVKKRGGKKFRRKVISHVNLMEQYNQRGIWWCPYCIGLYRFLAKGDRRYKTMYCPICGVSNKVFGVRQSNPLAIVVEMHQGVRRSRGSRRKRRSTT